MFVECGRVGFAYRILWGLLKNWVCKCLVGKPTPEVGLKEVGNKAWTRSKGRQRQISFFRCADWKEKQKEEVAGKSCGIVHCFVSFTRIHQYM